MRYALFLAQYDEALVLLIYPLRLDTAMSHPDSLPPVFAQYASKVRYVRRVSSDEWSSSCPSCGGDQHEHGEAPDRCRWFTKGKELGWCRRCSQIFWPDKADGYVAPSASQLAEWRTEQVAREDARKRSAERALAHLRDDEVWLRYYRQLAGDGRAYWRSRGIPDSWQDFWQFGWNLDWRTSTTDGAPWVTPSATIPLFDHDWNVLNVKHRLINPPDVGKYRYEVAGMSHPLFLCNPSLPLDGHVIAIEGEIKAAVVSLTLDDADARIIGLPGASPSPAILEQMKGAERVTLVLDPGARAQAEKMAQALGRKRCRVLITPQKIDDAIIDCQLSAGDVRAILAQARPCS